jgi:parvulin-like peptidyl-prolyl isomerase
VLATSTPISKQVIIDRAKIAGKMPELVQTVLRQQVIEARAKQLGIEPSTEDLQAAADRFRMVNKLESAQATWQWLKQHFLAVDDFEQLIWHNLVAEQLAHHMFGDNIDRFFHQNIIDYTTATIYEVLIEERELAMELFYAMQEGDLSFSSVAHQYITDPELRRRGGYVGTIGRRQLRPELSAAIFGAKAPQLIKPVITAIGVHLIYVEEIIQPQLDDRLRGKILTDMFDQWLQQEVSALVEHTPIEV